MCQAREYVHNEVTKTGGAFYTANDVSQDFFTLSEMDSRASDIHNRMPFLYELLNEEMAPSKNNRDLLSARTPWMVDEAAKEDKETGQQDKAGLVDDTENMSAGEGHAAGDPGELACEVRFEPETDAFQANTDRAGLVSSLLLSCGVIQKLTNSFVAERSQEQYVRWLHLQSTDELMACKFIMVLPS